MLAWDISPAGVRGVLSQTESAAETIGTEGKAAGPLMQDGATNSSSAIVAAALAEFAAKASEDLQALLNRTGAAMTGCADAVNAYVQGDLEMARNAQQAAAAAPTPDLPGRGGARPRGR